ncbi:hypothetical protein BFR69_00865 [Acinetobacter pittii]|uniref:hypothetical protein n=1 Tax=Acinetobacter calcoaceticus/baumannii complex TaxID=909768 RepID=UPI0002F74FB8|nr:MULTISPECIES: hypothetical protein [Acinetobacter calcoaceticus/baumannii complex]AUT33940.1 hypothetical protein C2U64_08860 [Acinetobacter pittii]EXG31121.1 hypothetical protein J733_2163 [Acinetobacter sp. 263903-2]KRI14832.1 hypothetical protein APC96_12470 [Acinetobacter pittii]MCE6395189.1 hypothetical protein [Acinetobacter pittii]OCY18586.1 hypothetical protein BFR64_15790 [Acinetobacter pittii]
MSNTQDKTACADLDVAKLVEDTIFWFEQRMETLNDIANSEGNVVLASGDAEKELNDEQSHAFKAGISTAISLIGKFPLSLDRPVNPIDLDDLEA